MSSNVHSPLTTVVIPFRDQESWIGEALDSVLNQSCGLERLEIMLVDDGSTDRSRSIARDLVEGARVRWTILNGEGGGPSRARNIGWRAGRGEWVQFLDADDVIHTRKIEDQLEAAETVNHSVGFLFSSWQSLARLGGEWRPDGPVRRPSISQDAVVDLLDAGNFVAMGSQLIRREWLEHVRGFDERHRLVEDVDFYLRLALAGCELRFVDTSFVSTFHREVPGSLGSRDPEGRVNASLRNARMVEQYWTAQAALSLRRTKTLATVYFQGAQFYSGRDRQRFKDLAQEVRRLDPGFVPPAPRILHWVSRILGYERAEELLASCRRIRQRWRNRQLSPQTEIPEVDL